MNPDVFFENFELLADAPNGVQKLRELILQLAVMGKLVPQDLDDESASVLSKKSAKSLKPVQEDEVPFDPPRSWIFTHMDQVSNAIHYGYTASANNSLTDVRLLRITDIQNNKVNWETVPGCEIDTQKMNSYALNNNDLLIARTGGTIGKSYLVENLALKAVFASYLIRIVPNNLIFPKYLKIYADSPLYWDQLYSKCAGTGQPNVNATSLKSLIIPLPPLAEQKLIVSKVEELMALCDKLEVRRQKKQELQSKLNSAALDGILNAENKEEFEQHWQRICENFDLLYDNPENVEKLRQVVLQLAVQGKLVPQNPEDEPASFLIDKIDNEKRNLVKVGKIKGINSESLEVADEIPILPENWELVKLDSIILFMDAGWSPACKNHPTEDEKTWGVLKTTSVQSLTFLWTEHKELPENLTPRPEYEVRAGDILITRAGPKKRVGICCLVKDTRSHLMISDKIIRFHLLDEFVFPEFVTLCLNTGFSQRIIESQKSGMAESQMNISQSKLRMTPIPLPPLAEQKRIVEKVEQLMGLCDELESKLRKEKGDSEKLMEAVVKGLLEGKETEKTELEEPIPLQVATIQLK